MTTPTRKKEYTEYLLSPKWQKIRKRSLFIAGNICEWCSGTDRLEVHHWDYRRLKDEQPEDLIVLCKKCHTLFDDMRKVRSERIRFWKRLEGWAKKVHGPNWQHDHHIDMIHAQFKIWLRTQ